MCDIRLLGFPKTAKPVTHRITLKQNLSQVFVGLIVLTSSLVLGGVLSIIIGLSFEAFFRISPVVILVDSLFLGLAVIVTLYFARYLVERTKSLLLVLFLAFCIMLGAGIIIFSGFFLSNPATFLYSDSRTVSFLLINLLFFITINIIVSGFVFFQQTVLEKEKAIGKEQVLKKQMELKFLSAKINPHFLFNSLNLLISLLKTPDKAEETLINLSDLLRYQLDISDAEKVAIETELEVVRKYLSIQKLRFGEKLSYEIESHSNGNIPPLIIQPLVENSIKHNIDHTDRLAVIIHVGEKNSRLIISISDSMQRLNPDMLGKGIGLTTTKKRVEQSGGLFSIINGGIELSFNHD
jgi:sensor histidine kinase YesM